MENLRKIKQECIVEERRLDFDLGLNYDDMELLCPKGKSLVSQTG